MEGKKEGGEEGGKKQNIGRIWDILSWPKHPFGFFFKMFPNFWPTQY